MDVFLRFMGRMGIRSHTEQSGESSDAKTGKKKQGESSGLLTPFDP
jgi:hypothetical protein